MSALKYFLFNNYCYSNQYYIFITMILKSCIIFLKNSILSLSLSHLSVMASTSYMHNECNARSMYYKKYDLNYIFFVIKKNSQLVRPPTNRPMNIDLLSDKTPRPFATFYIGIQYNIIQCYPNNVQCCPARLLLLYYSLQSRFEIVLYKYTYIVIIIQQSIFLARLVFLTKR